MFGHSLQGIKFTRLCDLLLSDELAVLILLILKSSRFATYVARIELIDYALRTRVNQGIAVKFIKRGRSYVVSRNQATE